MKKPSVKAWLMTVAVVVCMASMSYADSIAGYTAAGCFSSVNANTATCGSTAADAYLTFTASSFSGQTDSTGYMAIGGSNGYFGSLTLGSTAANYAGDSLMLNVVITEPGNGSNSVTAKLKGDVTALAGGGVSILFNNPTPITLSNGQLLTLDVNNVSIFPNTTSSNPVWITGDATLSGTAISAPEPSAALLLGTGLLSLGGLRRRFSRRLRLARLDA
jgi:hypothetical protein